MKPNRHVWDHVILRIHEDGTYNFLFYPVYSENKQQKPCNFKYIRMEAKYDPIHTKSFIASEQLWLTINAASVMSSEQLLIACLQAWSANFDHAIYHLCDIYYEVSLSNPVGFCFENI